MMDGSLRFVIVGHVDHGKSTLIGRLLYDTGSLPEDKIQTIKDAVEVLGGGFKFAYLLDHLEEERKQEATIDTAQTFFKTEKRRYTIIDAPGHVEFVKNMVTGASHAEAAILIIDVTLGVQEQTRRHAYILRMLGIDQVIVVVNKMDLVDYRRGSFDEVKKQTINFLNTIGVEPTFFIPISAMEGDGVAKPTEHLEWYSGPTVLKALDTFKKKPPATDKPLRFPIQDVYPFGEKNIAVGRVVSGVIRKRDKIIVLPEDKKTSIESLEEFGGRPSEAAAGKSIGLTVSGVALRRGQVISHLDYPPLVTDSFSGHVFWMEDTPYIQGEQITFKCATQQTQCNLQIENVFDSSTLKVIRQNGEKILNRQVANVKLKTRDPIIVEKFNHIPELGRFILEREDCCAGGIITELG